MFRLLRGFQVTPWFRWNVTSHRNMYISSIRVCSKIKCPSIYIYNVCVLWFRFSGFGVLKKLSSQRPTPTPVFFDLHGVVLIKRSEVCGKSLLFTRVSKGVFDISGMGYNLMTQKFGTNQLTFLNHPFWGKINSNHTQNRRCSIRSP